MRNKIFMYFFFFAVLFIIFQYMNEKKIFEDQDKKIKGLTEQVAEAQTMNDSLANAMIRVDYFTLQGNDNAMTYLEKSGREAIEVERLITDAIIDKNLIKGGNPLVPYDGIEGEMLVNKTKFLNHKWVLADFTDGKYWGEMIIEYYFDSNGELQLKVIDSVLYAQ